MNQAVLEVRGGVPCTVKCFSDFKKAENYFKELIEASEPFHSDDEINNFVDDGHYEKDDYEIYLMNE